jgi:hypothetical protein
LDDEFFSIDDFNRQTEEMESLSRSRGHLSVDDDEDDNEPEDVDLFHPLDEAPEAFDEGDEDANNLSSSQVVLCVAPIAHNVLMLLGGL